MLLASYLTLSLLEHPPRIAQAGADNLPMTRTLHALGAPLTDTLNGRTLLHHAASCGSVQVLAWICEEKATELPINTLDTKVDAHHVCHAVLSARCTPTWRSLSAEHWD